MTNASKTSVTSDKILLKNARLSFLRLEKPEAFEEGQVEKFQLTALLDPSDAANAEAIALIKQETQKLCVEAYGEVPTDIKATPMDRLPFGLADNHPKKKEYDGYKGMFYIYAANTVRPGIGNRKAEGVIPGEPEFPYSGCYGNVSISLWALLGPKRVKYGSRIGANLRAVQFVKDGDAFGLAPVSAEDEFDALEDNSPADAGSSADWDDDIPF